MQNGAEPGPELTAKQNIALESLLSGKSISGAAEEAKVHRNTAGKWLKQPAFRAALNGGLRASQEATEAAIGTLAEQSLAVVAKAIEDGNVQAAMTLLRGVGLLSGKRIAIGSTNAKTIERQQALAELTDM